MLRALIIASLVLLPGCLTAGTKGVGLRVTTPDGTPVPNAHLFAVVLGQSPVPLPVTPETLEEISTRETSSGWTDEEGVVRFDLDGNDSHVVFLRPPPVGPFALDPSVDGGAGAFRFYLEPGKSGLSADPVGDGQEPTLVLEVVR